MKVGDKRIKDEAVNGGRRERHSSAARTSLVGEGIYSWLVFSGIRNAMTSLVFVAFEHKADGVLHVFDEFVKGTTLAHCARHLDALSRVPTAFFVFVDDYRIFHGLLFVAAKIHKNRNIARH